MKVRPREFFADECVAQLHVRRVLVEVGHTAHLQRDEFPSGTLDIDWLPVVGARGWFLITKDERIRRRPIELQALTGAGVGAFVLTAVGELSGRDQADIIAKALPKMLRIIQKTRRPFVANITASSHVELLDLRTQVRRRARRK